MESGITGRILSIVRPEKIPAGTQEEISCQIPAELPDRIPGGSAKEILRGSLGRNPGRILKRVPR